MKIVLDLAYQVIKKKNTKFHYFLNLIDSKLVHNDEFYLYHI